MLGQRWQRKFGRGSGFKEWIDESPLCCFLALAAGGLYAAVYTEGPRADLARWGWGTSEHFWAGEVWRLFVNPVHHGSFFHLLFNLFWLMRLGRVLEEVAGTARMVAYTLAAAAFTGIACELTWEQGAIGLSALNYAFFGTVWVLRRHVPAFRQELDDTSIKLLIAWLFICIALTYTGAMRVANVGHFSGILFGMAVGWGCRIRRQLTPAARVAHFLPFLLLPAGLFYLVFPEWNPRWHAARERHARETQVRQPAPVQVAPGE